MIPGQGPEAVRTLAPPMGGETAGRPTRGTHIVNGGDRGRPREPEDRIACQNTLENMKPFYEVVSKRQAMDWSIATGSGEAMVSFTGYVRPASTSDATRSSKPRRGP